MDLSLSSEQEQLVGTTAALLAKHSTPTQVREAEPSGFDRSLWERLLALGAVAMAASADAGGWEASMSDLGLVAEQMGRFVAPVPTIEAQVAARLLERLGTDAASEVLRHVLDDGRLVTCAVHPAARGVARSVPAGAIADAVLVAVDDAIVLVPLDPPPPPIANLGSMPLADVQLPERAAVVASGPQAMDAFELALDDWFGLTAAALVGVGQRGLEIGVEYVKERQAFGAPIGSFQAISHRLADSAAALDGAQLVARSSAWAEEADGSRYGELTAMAFALAYEAARDATYRSLHFHGGYGFMMEYDIQLYYRRARAWALVAGGPAVVQRRIADKRYGAVGRVA